MTKKYVLLLMAIFFMFTACEEGTDQSESMPMRYWMTSGENVFSVDGFGTVNELDFTSVVLNANTLGVSETIKRKEIFFDFSLDSLYFLTEDNALTRIFSAVSGNTLAETLVYQFGDTVSMGSTVVGGFTKNGIYDARYGYAGQRIYLLGETNGRGIVLDELNLIGLDYNQIAGPLQDLGPGLEKPAAFDIAVGGNQVWVLYESGKLVAINLFDTQDEEGEIADFGPGAKDIHILKNGAVFVVNSIGLYKFVPGLAGGVPELIADVGPLKICRADNQDAKEVWVVSVSDEVYRINVQTGLVTMNVNSPFSVSSILPKGQYWVKNTKPIIEKPYFISGGVGSDTGLTLIENLDYNTFYTDIDGEQANIKATFVEAPPGVVFTQTGDTVASFDFPPGINTPLSFCGGYGPGQAKVKIEAVSDDGQISTTLTTIYLVDPVPVPPQVTWCVPPP